MDLSGNQAIIEGFYEARGDKIVYIANGKISEGNKAFFARIGRKIFPKLALENGCLFPPGISEQVLIEFMAEAFRAGNIQLQVRYGRGLMMHQRAPRTMPGKSV